MGDLTDELQDGEYIEEFVSGGPKHYSYLTSGGKTQMTIKGITLNEKNMKVVNFERLKGMVLAESRGEIVHRCMSPTPGSLFRTL